MIGDRIGPQKFVLAEVNCRGHGASVDEISGVHRNLCCPPSSTGRSHGDRGPSHAEDKPHPESLILSI